MASSRRSGQSVNVKSFTSLDPDSLVRVDAGTGTHEPHVVLYDTVSSKGKVDSGLDCGNNHLVVLSNIIAGSAQSSVNLSFARV